LTAAVIACSIVVRKTRVRPEGFRFFLKDGIESLTMKIRADDRNYPTRDNGIQNRLSKKILPRKNGCVPLRARSRQAVPSTPALCNALKKSGRPLPHPANHDGIANTGLAAVVFLGSDGPIHKKLLRPDEFDVALALNGRFFDRIQLLLQTRELAGRRSRILQGRRHGNDGITARHIAIAFSASKRSGTTRNVSRYAKKLIAGVLPVFPRRDVCGLWRGKGGDGTADQNDACRYRRAHPTPVTE
jgi:hypothetical protein